MNPSYTRFDNSSFLFHVIPNIPLATIGMQGYLWPIQDQQ